MDLTAAWRLSRVVKRLAAGRHPRARSARRRDGRRWRCRSASARRGGPRRRWSRRAASTFTCEGNSFSRWKHRQVDCFIAASEAIRQMLVADGVPADRTVTVHEGIDVEHVLAAPPVNVHEAFWLPHQRAGRRQRRGARAAQGPAPSDRGGAPRGPRDAGRAIRHPRRRRAARAARAAGPRATTSKSTCCCPGSAPTCSAASRGSTCSR